MKETLCCWCCKLKKVPGDEEGSFVRHTRGCASFEMHCTRWETELGTTLTDIKFFKKLHKKDQGKGEWCDLGAEGVATKYRDIVKKKNGVDDIVSIPFDDEAWAEATYFTKNIKGYGSGFTKQAQRIFKKAKRSALKRSPAYTSKISDEAWIESEVTTRLESHMKAFEIEMKHRIEEKVQLQKLVSQLELLGEVISQEDINQKFLRSLPSEWGMNVVVWRNKPDLETLSIGYLYNNLKIYESEVKGISSSTNTENMAFVSSSSNNSNSSNGVNTAQGVNTANGINTASSQVNVASALNIDNLSDAVICVFLASQPNSTQLVNEYLEQIYPDDLEEMDLKWKMAMLTMRARRFLKNTRRKMNLTGNDSVSFDKTKVECYNCHKRGRFERECGHQGDRTIGAEEGSRNYALMAYSTPLASSLDSEVSACFKSCLKAVENPKSTNEKLLTDLRKSEIMVVAYKEGLKSVKQRLEFFKTNEAKVDLAEIEKACIQLNVNKLENASKSLNKIIECQIVDNFKKGLGYNADPPPHTGLFPPPKSDLSSTRLEELFNEPKTKKLKDMYNEVEPESVRKYSDASIIKDWVSDDEEEEEVNTAKLKAAVNAAKVKAKYNVVKGKMGNAVKASACWGNLQEHLQDKGVIDSGFSRHMTWNMSFLTNHEEIDRGYVAFGGNSKGGKITGKVKIKTRKLDFENVYFVRELKFNLFSVSQICDKKNSVILTDTECIVLSPDFKLIDENQILLRVPRQNNVYNIDLKNIVPTGDLTCLFTKATEDESKL
uniref:Ribonuclease H-like domain-containing protein n=1 Tax=Tanacetum cinerariifolium TaxID=118510 RepID=A0A6L2JG55_TANCI|nr:ribonuclease H-like domain-containing protein [Tanacetum cinerariifolium]